MWQQWVNAVLGLWVLVIPFTGMSGNTLTFTLAITGIAVAALATWGAIQLGSEKEEVGEMRLQHR